MNKILSKHKSAHQCGLRGKDPKQKKELHRDQKEVSFLISENQEKKVCDKESMQN